MKKFIPLLLAMAVMLLAWGSFAPAHAQDPAKEEKPTFYRLTPGVYVNGWPRFTVTYPKDWVERPTNWPGGEVFRVSSPEPAKLPVFIVLVGSSYPLPLEKVADLLVMVMRTRATDVTVVSDKPSRFRDGTPAREVEITMVINSIPRSQLALVTKKGDLWIMTNVVSLNGRMEEDLKAIPYSLQFEPGKDEPVKVPPDIQEFLDRWRNDIVSHDVAKVMTHYSDKYLNSGTRKGEMERFFRQLIGLGTSYEVGITDFIPAGDRAYLAGFGVSNLGKSHIQETSIIKENGEWKWYGNQRDPAP